MLTASRWASASPTPVPSMPVTSAPSRSNGVNSRGMAAGSIPRPVSRTDTSSSDPLPGVAPHIHHPAPAVVFDSVGQEVVQNLSKPTLVGVDEDFTGGGRLIVHGNSHVPGRRRGQRNGLTENVVDRNRLDAHLHTGAVHRP